MNCEVKQNLIGCSVVIETKSNMTVEGLVLSVDPSCSRILLDKPVSPSGILPSQYRIFAKDVYSVKIIARGNVKTPIERVKTVNPIQSKIKPLIQQKSIPKHIAQLDNDVETDVLVNKSPQLKNGAVAINISVAEYLIIEKIDDMFYNVMDKLKQQKVIGVSMEGITIGRSGIVCWLGIGTMDSVYLFDMCSLGLPGIQQGLADVLHNPDIIKVLHDCRFVSDALLHQYEVKIENVFDTQVAASIIELHTTGSFNKFVITLNRCLNDNLHFPIQTMFQSRIRTGHEKEDADKWKQRPLPQHLIEGAVFNVCHLRNLRLVLIEKLLSPVTIGTNMYLKEVSSLSDDAVPEKLAFSHLIPLSFQELAKSRTTGSREIFRNEVSGECLDPYIKFARNIPHVKTTF